MGLLRAPVLCRAEAAQLADSTRGDVALARFSMSRARPLASRRRLSGVIAGEGVGARGAVMGAVVCPCVRGEEGKLRLCMMTEQFGPFPEPCCAWRCKVFRRKLTVAQGSACQSCTSEDRTAAALRWPCVLAIAGRQCRGGLRRFERAPEPSGRRSVPSWV